MGEKMGRGKRLKLGNIYEIGLPNGKKAYARLFKEYTLAIYNGFYNDYSEVPFVEQYFRFIGVYKDLLTDGVWKVVGNRKFENEEDAWAPPSCVISADGKTSLYYKGNLTECVPEECENLEVAAAWDRHHVVDMLGRFKVGSYTSFPSLNFNLILSENFRKIINFFL